MLEREHQGQEQQKLQQTEQQRNVLGSLLQTVDGHLRQVAAGQTTLDASGVMARIKTAHDQLSRLVEAVTTERVTERYVLGLKEEIAKTLPASERGAFLSRELKDYSELIGAARDFNRKGYVSDREAK